MALHSPHKVDLPPLLPAPLLLASTSPRRRQILESMGLLFSVRRPSAEEVLLADIEETVRSNALRKAASVTPIPLDAVVIGADTLVSIDGAPLGKPSDSKQAREMLSMLSGRVHEVLSGIALVSAKWGTRQAVCRSKVHFRKISDDELSQYCATREPYDKAGAYAVQGAGAIFITGIEGSYTNVMGLPVECFLQELAEYSGHPVFDWFR